MKRSIITLIAMSLLFLLECNNKVLEEEFDDTQELSKYNGYVIVSKTLCDNSTSLDVKDPISYTRHFIDVSKKTYNLYDVGDTIHVENHDDTPQIQTKVGSYDYVDDSSIEVHVIYYKGQRYILDTNDRQL